MPTIPMMAPTQKTRAAFMEGLAEGKEIDDVKLLVRQFKQLGIFMICFFDFLRRYA